MGRIGKEPSSYTMSALLTLALSLLQNEFLHLHAGCCMGLVSEPPQANH